MSVAEVEDLPDYFGDRRRALDDWDEDAFRSDRLAGALMQTTCPHCNLLVGAFIRNTDTPWLDLVCPVCKQEFTERDGVLEQT